MGNGLTVRDYDQDGIATSNIDEQQMNGTYQLQTISLRDNAYNSNSIELKADGTTQIWDGVNNTWIYGEHDHKLTKLSFNVEGGVAPQTDFTSKLVSYNIKTGGVLAGGRLNVSYEASGEGSNVGHWLTFQRVGNDIFVTDYNETEWQRGILMKIK